MFWLLWKQGILVSTRAPNLRVPVSVWVTPATIFLRGLVYMWKHNVVKTADPVIQGRGYCIEALNTQGWDQRPWSVVQRSRNLMPHTNSTNCVDNNIAEISSTVDIAEHLGIEIWKVIIRLRHSHAANKSSLRRKALGKFRQRKVGLKFVRRYDRWRKRLFF